MGTYLVLAKWDIHNYKQENPILFPFNSLNFLFPLYSEENGSFSISKMGKSISKLGQISNSKLG